MLGLASGLERKNGRTLAEHAGDAAPDGMQRLLNAAAWDADKVRDALGRYVARHFGDQRAVLIADETGFEKAGIHSAGVQRQRLMRCSPPLRIRAVAAQIRWPSCSA